MFKDIKNNNKSSLVKNGVKESCRVPFMLALTAMHRRDENACVNGMRQQTFK